MIAPCTSTVNPFMFASESWFKCGACEGRTGTRAVCSWSGPAACPAWWAGTLCLCKTSALAKSLLLLVALLELLHAAGAGAGAGTLLLMLPAVCSKPPPGCRVALPAAQNSSFVSGASPRLTRLGFCRGRGGVGSRAGLGLLVDWNCLQLTNTSSGTSRHTLQGKRGPSRVGACMQAWRNKVLLLLPKCTTYLNPAVWLSWEYDSMDCQRCNGE